MKKITYIITFFISIISFSQNEESKLSPNDISQINELVKQFENVLKKYYPSNSTEKSFELYLSDLELQKVNPAIIKEELCLKSFDEFKKTTTFNKIWIEQKTNTSKKSYRINLNGDFYNYLIKNTTNLDVKKGYTEFRKIKDISPFLLVSALKQYLKSSEYKSEINKISITIMFYYDILLEYS